jgi:hypothetical protein
MVGEIVRVKPRNAVQRDVELTILETTDRRAQVLHQARAIRIHRPDARGELDDVRIVRRGGVIVLNEFRANN